MLGFVEVLGGVLFAPLLSFSLVTYVLGLSLFIRLSGLCICWVRNYWFEHIHIPDTKIQSWIKQDFQISRKKQIRLVLPGKKLVEERAGPSQGSAHTLSSSWVWAPCTVPRIFFFFFLFRAAPAAYRSSQARGLIRAAAAGLCHSTAGSKPSLQPTPQLTAVLDPQLTKQGQGSNPHLMDTSWVCDLLSHNGNSQFLAFSGCFIHSFLSWTEERRLEKANRARASDEEGREGAWRRLPLWGYEQPGRSGIENHQIARGLAPEAEQLVCPPPLKQGLRSGVNPWQRALTPTIGISLIQKGKKVSICPFCCCY